MAAGDQSSFTESDRMLWDSLIPMQAVTIVKTYYDHARSDVMYPARMIPSEHPGWFAFEAVWTLPDMNVDGVHYETDGRMLEYFSPIRMFNVFHVFRRNGESSGYYANVTEYPLLECDEHGELRLTWIDLWLDVIKLPNGEVVVLDEDEFLASGIESTNPELARGIRSACRDAEQSLASNVWLA